MTPKRERQLTGLAELGYEVIRHGSLGLTLRKHPYFLRWADLGPFLNARMPRQPKRKTAAVYKVLEHLAARTPEPWEARRREYLEEVGRREVSESLRGR